MSELEIFTSMYEDWVGFVQNTLAGHWIIYIIVLVDMIVSDHVNCHFDHRCYLISQTT